jgi:hypothetical protein
VSKKLYSLNRRSSRKTLSTFLNLAQQGAKIKEGAIDPTTGKKKTDIDGWEVAKNAAFGAVAAPLGGAAFKAVPTVVGALGLAGVGHGVSSGIENVQKGNNYSAALDFGTAVFAALPFATKGGRSAMFGAKAREQTAQTAGKVWNGAGDLAGRAWNGAGNLAGRAWNGAGEMANRAWQGTGELASRALTSAGNWGSRVLTGAGNFGIRAINFTKNGVFDIADALGPKYAPAEGMSLGGDRPKDIPLIKNEPMRMQSNNPEGQLPQSLQSKTPTTPNLPELKDIKLGKELGKGGNKIAYEVPGREDLAIAVLKPGKSAASIDEEIGLLNTLKEQGLPTTEVMGTTTHNGQPAVVMKKYAQGSKDVVVVDNGKVRRVGDSGFLNEKSIQDLNKIKQIMELKKIKVNDLQFLIGKDGSVVIADPLNVSVGEKIPGVGKNKNFKMIDKLIEAATDNINK